MKNSSGRDSYSVPMLFLFVPGYFWKLSYFTLFDSTASLPCFSMTWTYIYIPFELSYSKISKYFSENQEQGRTPTLARWVGELFSGFSQNSSLLFPGLTSELLFFFFPFMGSFICWFDADPDPCMNCFFLFIKKNKNCFFFKIFAFQCTILFCDFDTLFPFFWSAGLHSLCFVLCT